MHILGMHGYPRRLADPTVYDYLPAPAILGMNQFMTYQRLRPGAVAVDLRRQLLLQPVRRPQAPGRTRGTSNTLEWAAPSPPPHGNFETIPTVYHAAYEYSVPGVADDYLPQTEPRPAEAGPLDPVMA